MNKNAICQINKTPFEIGEEIYVVKLDHRFDMHELFGITTDCDEFYLSMDAHGTLFEENEKFKLWWDANTRVLEMSSEDLKEEFGSDAQDILSEASYYTTFDPEDED